MAYPLLCTDTVTNIVVGAHGFFDYTPAQPGPIARRLLQEGATSQLIFDDIFKGWMDELVLFEAMPSPETVELLYRDALTDSAGLLARYPFDEGGTSPPMTWGREARDISPEFRPLRTSSPFKVFHLAPRNGPTTYSASEVDECLYMFKVSTQGATSPADYPGSVRIQAAISRKPPSNVFFSLNFVVSTVYTFGTENWAQGITYPENGSSPPFINDGTRFVWGSSVATQFGETPQSSSVTARAQFENAPTFFSGALPYLSKRIGIVQSTSAMASTVVFRGDTSDLWLDRIGLSVDQPRLTVMQGATYTVGLTMLAAMDNNRAVSVEAVARAVDSDDDCQIIQDALATYGRTIAFPLEDNYASLSEIPGLTRKASLPAQLLAYSAFNFVPSSCELVLTVTGPDAPRYVLEQKIVSLEVVGYRATLTIPPIPELIAGDAAGVPVVLTLVPPPPVGLTVSISSDAPGVTLQNVAQGGSFVTTLSLAFAPNQATETISVKANGPVCFVLTASGPLLTGPVEQAGRAITDFSLAGTPTCVSNACKSSGSADLGVYPSADQSDMTSLSCKPCPIGTYLDSSASNTPRCLPCPDGSDLSQLTEAMLSCPLCIEGSTSTAPGYVCSPCPAGTYSDLSTDALCRLCEDGFYAEEPGSPSCTRCDDKFIANPLTGGPGATLSSQCKDYR